MNRDDELLNKPLEECTVGEVFDLRNCCTDELKRRAAINLKRVAAQYIEGYGEADGINKMGEDLCRLIATNMHPGGWAGLVHHLMKISG